MPVLAHWLYDMKRMVSVSEAADFMRAMPSGIRWYIKSMQKCEDILSITLQYTDGSIVGIEVLNIIPYNHIPGRMPKISLGEDDIEIGIMQSLVLLKSGRCYCVLRGHSYRLNDDHSWMF